MKASERTKHRRALAAAVKRARVLPSEALMEGLLEVLHEALLEDRRISAHMCDEAAAMLGRLDADQVRRLGDALVRRETDDEGRLVLDLRASAPGRGR